MPRTIIRDILEAAGINFNKRSVRSVGGHGGAHFSDTIDKPGIPLSKNTVRLVGGNSGAHFSNTIDKLEFQFEKSSASSAGGPGGAHFSDTADRLWINGGANDIHFGDIIKLICNFGEKVERLKDPGKFRDLG